MVIEALINGQVLTAETLADELLSDIPGATWQENAQMREYIVRAFILQVQDKLNRFFNEKFQVEYRLVFPSKMNNEQATQPQNAATERCDQNPAKHD